MSAAGSAAADLPLEDNNNLENAERLAKLLKLGYVPGGAYPAAEVRTCASWSTAAGG